MMRVENRRGKLAMVAMKVVGVVQRRLKRRVLVTASFKVVGNAMAMHYGFWALAWT